MAKFNIYTYMFAPVVHTEDEPDFCEDFEQTIEESLVKKQEILSSFFEDDFKFNFRDSEGTYFHKWLVKQDGIFVLRIANNKATTIETNFKEEIIPNYPSLIVIIDNRHDRQVIAIQKSKAWSKTSDVANILQETFNSLLRPKYRIQLSINPKFHTHEFWKIVKDFPNGILKVTFHFPYPNLPAISDLVGEFYKEVALETNSEPSTTLSVIPKQKTVKLEETSFLLKNMIAACAASGKPIIMEPRGGAKIRCGENNLVEEVLSDVALDDLSDKDELFKSKMELLVKFLNKIKLVYE